MVEKRYCAGRIARALEDLESRYGSIDELHRMVDASRCSRPQLVDDYMTWKAIQMDPDLDYEEVLYIEDPSFFDTVSPKRMELLDYLAENSPPSVKDLAERLGRNYKNVYDDIKALASRGLVETVKEGKNLRPRSDVVRIVTVIS